MLLVVASPSTYCPYRPATEDVALYCSLAGVALYLISFVTVTVKAFSHKE